MITLLSDRPLCLDCSGRANADGYDADDRCTHTATCELLIEGTWGAYCDRCAKYWNPTHVQHRPLTAATEAVHFYAQSRPGGRLR